MSRLRNPFVFGSDLWDPSNRFATSWLLPPWLLAVFRGIFSLYAFFTLFFAIGWQCTHEAFGGCTASGQSFSYFTYLTLWGLAFYLLVAATHTATYALQGRSLLDRLSRPLQALHALFYTTIITFPFLVTIVYWGILYDGPWFPREFDAWHNISQHALNSAYALFEIFIPRTNPPLAIHLLWLIVILLLYLALAFITVATQGFYVYDFLSYKHDGGRGYVAAYVIGIAVGICVVFGIVWAAIWGRRWVTEKKMGRDGKFAQQRSLHDDVEMNTFAPKERNGL